MGFMAWTMDLWNIVTKVNLEIRSLFIDGFLQGKGIYTCVTKMVRRMNEEDVCFRNI